MLPRTILALLLAASPAALADVLLIDGLESARQSASERPARGVTMASVESKFGAPLQRYDAVGDPPITRWEYPDFTVYFEYDRVIHAVARHGAAVAAAGQTSARAAR
ncbi:MAG TPA: hypothetical protein VF329_12975 [Gammaproteobacteria bacterium]